MSDHLVVNGLEIVVESSDQVTERLLSELMAMQPLAGARRAIAFLAGPPGTGKSTLAEQVRARAATQGQRIDVVGLDGFHHRQDYLRTHWADVNGRRVRLDTVKGCPESFDLDALVTTLSRSLTRDERWPAYDRTVHDVRTDAIDVTADRVLVEGNWLLLDEPGWRELVAFCSFSVFLDADPADLRNRLISRKQAGGLSREEATAFYEASDRHNVARCLNNSNRATDMTLRALPDGRVEVVTEH